MKSMFLFCVTLLGFFWLMPFDFRLPLPFDTMAMLFLAFSMLLDPVRGGRVFIATFATLAGAATILGVFYFFFAPIIG